jgi:hypothetical protein
LTDDRVSGPDVGLRSLVRILLYYGVLTGAMLLLLWRFPALETLFTMGELPGAARDLGLALDGGGSLTTEIVRGWPGVAVAVVSLLGTLVFMVPVAWTYIFIKKAYGYDESVVHTLLILPIAVTGIVLIVKSSLALAFSLAGIVAAVRFRTTLDDTKDAVYVFLAIGVGLASGVQALGVAASLSFVFNVVNLVLWRLNFGNIYADQMHRTGGLGLGDALAGPESRRGALSFGDPRLAATLAPRELKEVADRMARTHRYLEAESDVPKERKLYALLMVYTDQAGPAQAAVEPVLEQMAVRWSLAEILPGDNGVSVLEYLVRMRDGYKGGALLDALHEMGTSVVKGAELRSLKGLAKRG